jgi:hypothetical protein
VIIYSGVSADNSNGSGENETPTTTQPLAPPMFTGSLELYLKRGMEPFIRRLLSLPDSIHSRGLTLTCFSEEDLSSTTALVEGCSHTLESVDIILDFRGASGRHLRPHP